MTKVTIYTDGACSGNPGPGGYGAVILSNGTRRELSQGYRRTTNNRMELMAAIAALETLAGPSTVDLYTDSRYLVDAIEKGWARKWQAKGWMRNKREKALNPDLWARLLTDLATHNVKLHWVRGHAGNRENERCDRLAVAAIRSKKSIDDEGFLRPSSPGPCTTNMF